MLPSLHHIFLFKTLQWLSLITPSDALLQGSQGSTFSKSLTPSLAIPLLDCVLLNWPFFYFLKHAYLLFPPGTLHMLLFCCLPRALLAPWSHCWNHLHDEASTQKSSPHFSQHLISIIIHINSGVLTYVQDHVSMIFPCAFSVGSQAGRSLGAMGLAMGKGEKTIWSWWWAEVAQSSVGP